MGNKKKSAFIYASLFVLILFISILLYFINQFDIILYEPPLTPEDWCDGQPCLQIELFSTIFILVQPSSTFFVYLLGSLTVIIGLYLIKVSRKQRFIAWWGIALLLWGVGAIFAGTSYQAFSYEIKCAGRTSCVWTSWWEIMYLILSVGSVNAMMFAQSSLINKKKPYIAMRTYAAINFLIYVLIVVIGSEIPIQFLISFELMVTFLVPSIVIFILFNFQRWKALKQPIDLHFLLIWVVLITIMAAYFLYFMLGITEVLWEQGFWFSENDLLHIGLIAWMCYIGFITIKFRKASDLDISQ